MTTSNLYRAKRYAISIELFTFLMRLRVCLVFLSRSSWCFVCNLIQSLDANVVSYINNEFYGIINLPDRKSISIFRPVIIIHWCVTFPFGVWRRPKTGKWLTANDGYIAVKQYLLNQIEFMIRRFQWLIERKTRSNSDVASAAAAPAERMQ